MTTQGRRRTQGGTTTRSAGGGAPAPGAPARPAAARSAGVAAIPILGLAMIVLAVPAALRADAAAAAAGAKLYKEKCVGCHGADGSGNTPMGRALKAGNLRKPEILAKKDAELAASVTNGKGMMPPQKGNLSAVQIQQILAYVRAMTRGK